VRTTSDIDIEKWGKATEMVEEYVIGKLANKYTVPSKVGPEEEKALRCRMSWIKKARPDVIGMSMGLMGIGMMTMAMMIVLWYMLKQCL